MDVLEVLTSVVLIPSSLNFLQTMVAGGLATTLHSMMSTCCSSGMSVFPLTSTSLADTVYTHAQFDSGIQNCEGFTYLARSGWPLLELGCCQ